MMNLTIASIAVVSFFALQAFVEHQESAIVEQNLNANISGAIMQCLPEQVDEVCTIALVQDRHKLKLVTERHSLKHFGQPPVKQPAVKFVVAMDAAK